MVLGGFQPWVPLILPVVGGLFRARQPAAHDRVTKTLGWRTQLEGAGMPTKNDDSTKKFTRNPGRKLETVSFTLPDIFGETPFEVPHFQHCPVGLINDLMESGPGVFVEFFEKNGAVAEAEAFAELEMGEAELFMTEWQKASKADFPK